MRRALLLAVVMMASAAASSAAPPAPGKEAGEAGKPKRPISFLDCKKLSWVENCQEIDEAARQNPGAPLRLTNPEGLEFYFVPGTPSTMIYHQLNPTRESAKALIDYHKRYMAQMQKAANITRQVLTEMGEDDIFSLMAPLEGVGPKPQGGLSTPASAQSPARIKAENIKVWMFYDSKCAPCKQTIPEVYMLVQRNPKLDLTLLQLDEDPDYIEGLRADMNLKAGPIPPKDRAALAAKIRQTPTFWVQDTRNKKTTVMEGYMTVDALASKLAQLSQ